MAMKMSLAYKGKETAKEEKAELGEKKGKRKDRESPDVPEGAEGLSHTFRRISNGWIQSTSYKHPKTGDYNSFEVYHESPDTFSSAEGLD